MPPPEDPSTLAEQARGVFVRQVVAGLPAIAQALEEAARDLMLKTAAPEVTRRRVNELPVVLEGIPQWAQSVQGHLRSAQADGTPTLFGRALAAPPKTLASLTLVDEDSMTRDLSAGRLARGIEARCDTEFNYLRTRLCLLEGLADLHERDLLRSHVLARMALEGWLSCRMSLDSWSDLQPTLQPQLADAAAEAYYAANRWLRDKGVMPEIDLRSRIRRADDSGKPGERPTAGAAAPLPPPAPAPAPPPQDTPSAPMAALERLRSFVGEPPDTAPVAQAAEALAAATSALSSQLSQAMDIALNSGLTRLVAMGDGQGHTPEVPELIETLDQQRQKIKRAASTQDERSSIEIVALMFQNILAEDRIPPGLRVWFARLQVPVIRVAVAEPEFFADKAHPARRLIDRMGACVLGFDGPATERIALIEQEIRRLVQVIESFPETGSRIFGTALGEFEQFLQRFFSESFEAGRRGVTLAQQIEQRQMFSVRCTIELRKMLGEVPVAPQVQDFLYGVWADVMATVSVVDGAASPRALAMKRVAADLIWSAAAKSTREERTEVLQKMPALQRALREGMTVAGVDIQRQGTLLRGLNEAFAAGFTAKAAVIPGYQIQALTEQFESLEELLPDADEIDIDESMVREVTTLSGSALEVVTTGGEEPDAPALERARALELGSWCEMATPQEGAATTVQLVWRGMRGQLFLFLDPQGVPRLFQLRRLAAHLRAGLLRPLEQESLTTRASRKVLDILVTEPQRLED